MKNQPAATSKAAFASAPTVDVLVVVDVEGALSSGNLNSNLYMVDTTGYLGAGREGTDELVTIIGNGQGIVWSVAPVDPATNVAIIGFGGQAIGQEINPVQLPAIWGSPWQASTTIGPGTNGTQYQYTMTLQYGGPTGVTQTFDPFLQSDVA